MDILDAILMAVVFLVGICIGVYIENRSKKKNTAGSLMVVDQNGEPPAILIEVDEQFGSKEGFVDYVRQRTYITLRVSAYSQK